MTNFVIENDVPYPSTSGYSNRPRSPARVAIEELLHNGSPGDSIFFEGHTARSIAALLYMAQKKAGVSGLLSSRTVENGVRVWRFAPSE
jgi:hypothetical protein